MSKQDVDTTGRPSETQVLEIIHGELSSSKRWTYRLILGLSLIFVLGLLSMWLTEPEPLPTRLNVAFGSLTLIGTGWIGVLTWILFQKTCPSAIDRIATSWMATFATTLSLLVSVSIAVLRNDYTAAVSLGVLGTALLSIALLCLVRAYSHRKRLKSRLAELSKSSHSVAKSLLLLLCLTILPTHFVSANDDLKIDRTEIPTRNRHSIEAEAGTLSVPMSRANPDGKKIEIAFIRIKGTNPDTPPTFFLAGGPGESGINLVKGMFFDGSTRIRKILDGDIIGIDQRGVGNSRPELFSDKKYQFAIEQPGNRERYLKKISQTCQKVAKQLQTDGIDLRAFNTSENANDIESLRSALAYDKINLWGTSYGSHLGLAILNQHPDSINKAMFCSPEGPNHTFKHPGHVTACLERLSEDNHLLETMQRVLDKLEDQPVEFAIKAPKTGQEKKVGISAFDIELFTWNALGRIETTKRLDGLFQKMDREDFTFPAMWLVRYRESAGVGSVMKHLMDAASGCSIDRQTVIEDELKNCLVGQVINFPLDNLKNIWNIPELPDDFRVMKEAEIPVLIVVGELDAKTPIENAIELLEYLPNGRLIKIEGGGHGLVPHPEVLGMIGKFFGNAEIPAVQTITLR